MMIRLLRFWVTLVALLICSMPTVAFAQQFEGDSALPEIPYLAQVVGLIVAIFGLVSAFVPDEKMPPLVKQIVNWLALNIGKAKNAPNQ